MSLRPFLLALLLAAPAAALAQPAPPGAAAPEASGPTLELSFRGTLREALKKIAEEGGLNLVVMGALDTPAEVHLKGVSAEQALRTVARAYDLRLEEEGGIYTLRPLRPGESPQASPGRQPPAPPPPLPGGVPVPPPPGPGLGPDREAVEEMKERAREAAAEARRSVRRSSNSAVARGQNLEVHEGDRVESAVVYGGNLTVRGDVEGDAVVFDGNMEVFGRVEGDVSAFSGNVVLRKGAVVEGDVAAFGGNVEREPGAVVEGSVDAFGGAGLGAMIASGLKGAAPGFIGPDEDEAAERAPEEEPSRDGSNWLAGFLVSFAVLFSLGFLFRMFAPSRMREIGTEIRVQPLRNGLVGLLGALALVPLTVLLAITLIGIPVVVVMWLVVGLAVVAGYTALASEVGMRLPVMRGRKTQALVLALGLLALLLVSQVPVVGPLVNVLACLVALGAIIRTRFGQRPRGTPEPLMPPPSASAA